MIKLSEYNGRSSFTTPSGVRQTVKASIKNAANVADALRVAGDATTRHFTNFEELTALGGPVDLANISKVTNTGWKFVGSAGLATDWFAFGSKSLKLATTSSYAYLAENIQQYKTCVNGWTEEFVYRPDVSLTNSLIFRSYNSANYGVSLWQKSTNDLSIYLSSNGSSWNIASALVIPASIVVGGQYHIAISYDPATAFYKVFINGILVWSKASGNRICTIAKKIFGWSGGAAKICHIDEYKFSNTVLYTSNFTPPVASYVLAKPKTAYVLASDETPFEVSFASGVEERRSEIYSDLAVGGGPFNTSVASYISASLSALDVIELGVTPIPPQHAHRFDNSRHSLLNFRSMGETFETVGGVSTFSDSIANNDRYGNIWLADPDVMKIKKTAGMLPYVEFSGTLSTPMLSDIFTLPERWTLKMAFVPDNVAKTTTLFSFGGNVSAGEGLRIDVVTTAVNTYTLKVYISTMLGSYNVANGVVVTGGSTNIVDEAVQFKMTFDGNEYKIVTSSGSTMSWTNNLPILAVFGARMELGRWLTASYYQGKLYEFSLEPLAEQLVAGQRFPLAETNVRQIRDDIYWFDIAAMKMWVSDTTITPCLAPGDELGFITPTVSVFIGELKSNSLGEIIDINSYAINGIHRTPWFNAVSAGQYPIQHNLGTTEFEVHGYVNRVPSDRNKRILADAQYDSDGTTGRNYGPSFQLITETDMLVAVGNYGITNPTNRSEGAEYATGYYQLTFTRAF
jgi:hypothetical protein